MSTMRGGSVVERKIKEKNRYMRIKSLKRSHERKMKIAPADWQEFIEIQVR